MADLKNLNKGKQQLKDLIKEAPQRCGVDQKQGLNALNFERVLNYVSKEANIDPPTKEQAHELFNEFNDKNSHDGVIAKDEFNNFIEKVLEMLAAANPN